MGRVSSAIPKSVLTTIGDLIAASAVNTPARIAAPALGQVPISQGAATLPIWSATPLIDGIAFPAVQVSSANANTQDDYKENTWNPTIESAGGGVAAAYTIQDGAYVKVGQLVVANFDVELNGKGTLGAGQLRIGGLPFSRLVADGNYPGLALGYFGGMTTLIYWASGIVNGAVIEMYMLNAAAAAAQTLTIADASVTVRFAGSVAYRATA